MRFLRDFLNVDPSIRDQGAISGVARFVKKNKTESPDHLCIRYFVFAIRTNKSRDTPIMFPAYVSHSPDV